MLKNIHDWSKDEVNNLDFQLEKSTALRFLTHIIGDVHQPLHSCALFNDKFPHGDEGGNNFTIVYSPDPTMKELHAWFDSGAKRLIEIERVI